MISCSGKMLITCHWILTHIQKSKIDDHAFFFAECFASLGHPLRFSLPKPRCSIDHTWNLGILGLLQRCTCRLGPWGSIWHLSNQLRLYIPQGSRQRKLSIMKVVLKVLHPTKCPMYKHNMHKN
jgi:hypothetical protein